MINLPSYVEQGARNVLGIYRGEGRFGVVITNYSDVDWYHCREQFGEDHPRVRNYLFMTDSPTETKAFIEHAEAILKIPAKDCSTLSKTNKQGILHIHLGNFWNRCPARQLFTILLRAGRLYNPKAKNFWETVKKSDYIGRGWSFYAFQRFMNGHTIYTGKNFNGWCAGFSYIGKETIDKRLVKNAD